MLSLNTYIPKRITPVSISQKQTRLVLTHVFIWIFYIAYELSIRLFTGIASISLWDTFFSFSLYACIFYINALVLLPKFLVPKQYLLLIGSTFLLLGIFLALQYVLKVYLLPNFGQELTVPFVSLPNFLASYLWRGGYFLILSFAYWFATYSINVEKEKRRLEEKRFEDQVRLGQLENNLVKAEINFLKDQINPHFLFNTLNFFYSQVYPFSESTAKGILLLSDIMRYALEGGFNNGKVMLEEEIKNLQSYIAINQLRYQDGLQIKLDIAGSFQFRMITPLVLITLVENCFKHGDLMDPQHPLIIKIEVSNDQFLFYTRNKKRVGGGELALRRKSTGIGLANIQKRLALEYGDRFSLQIEDEALFYTCMLTISL